MLLNNINHSTFPYYLKCDTISSYGIKRGSECTNKEYNNGTLREDAAD